MLSPKLRQRLLKSRDLFPGSLIWHPAPVLKYKKLSQAKEIIFYLRCDPWRAGRGQESGPVGRQLFIPGRWYLPVWHIYIRKEQQMGQGTSPQYQNRYLDLVVWYFVSSSKSIQIVRRQCCLSRLGCRRNMHFDVLHVQQIESNLFAQKVFPIWNVAHNLDQLVGDLNLVFF